MDNKIFTSPLFLSTVVTLIVVLIVYFYNSHQEKKEDKESKGGIYYFGLLVLVFCLCYGALYLYNNLTSSGPTEVAKKVMEGGKKLIDEIKPETVVKEITAVFELAQDKTLQTGGIQETLSAYESIEDMNKLILSLEKEMKEAADDLEFEKAAEIRDRIKELNRMFVFEL